jgi:hypothetical protein
MSINHLLGPEWAQQRPLSPQWRDSHTKKLLDPNAPMIDRDRAAIERSGSWVDPRQVERFNRMQYPQYFMLMAALAKDVP